MFVLCYCSLCACWAASNHSQCVLAWMFPVHANSLQLLWRWFWILMCSSAHKNIFFPRYWRRNSTKLQKEMQKEIEIIRPNATATYIRTHHHHISRSNSLHLHTTINIFIFFFFVMNRLKSGWGICEKGRNSQKVNISLTFKAVHLLQRKQQQQQQNLYRLNALS